MKAREKKIYKQHIFFDVFFSSRAPKIVLSLSVEFFFNP